jgi:hypothetical protein
LIAMPSTTAIVFRISYRRPSWRAGVWKYKLFNSEQAADNYVAKLTQPPDEKTPEKFRNLGTVEYEMHAGMVTWSPVGAAVRASAPTAYDPVGDMSDEELYEAMRAAPKGSPREKTLHDEAVRRELER